jgi:pentatricopeptide repeat protein
MSRRVVTGPKQASLLNLDRHSGGPSPSSRTASTRHPRVNGITSYTNDYEVDEEALAEAAALPAPRPRPDRPVYLITSDKNDPLKRTARDVTRQHKPRHDTHTERRQRDEERDLIFACQGYTEHFNNLLRKLPRRDKRIVLMVIERMRTENIAMDQQTYNLLLEKVVDLRDPIAFEIYEDFKTEAQRDDATVRPDGRTFELMVRACERNGDYRRAFHIYSQMKELFGVYPDVPLYNALIGYCAPLRDETTASFIIEEMKDRNVEPDVHTYNALMNVFADAPYELVLQAFDDMIRRKLKPNRRTFNTLMKSCQRIGDYDRVFQFFEELKQEGLSPDVTTYNILLVACRDRLDYVIGTGRFSDVRRTKEQRELGIKAIAQLCMSLRAEMEELGVPANSFTYNALLSVLSQCRDRRMFQVLDEMIQVADQQAQTVRATAHQDYIKTEGAIPSFVELERMLDSAVAQTTQSGGVGDSDGQADRLGAFGVRPSIETYATIIEGCHRMGVTEKAHEHFVKMKQRGIKPDRHIYIKLIDVCALKAEKQTAFDLFDECCAQGIIPDTGLFNALINVLAECCDPRVHEIFLKLKHDTDGLSVKPNQDSYNLMLKAALKTRRLDDANRLYQEMTSPTCVVSPDTASYSILMDICAACKDVRRAAYYIEDMRRRHVTPTINTYSRFMNVFVAAGDPGVVEVFENIKRHGPQPNLEAYTTLLQYYLETRNDAIIGLFDDMKRDGVDPDLNAYNVMLKYAAVTQNNQRAYKYLEELKPRGLNADIDTYNALMAVFAPSGSDMIFKVFEDMAMCHVPPNKETFSILMKHPKGRAALNEATTRNLVQVDSQRL